MNCGYKIRWITCTKQLDLSHHIPEIFCDGRVPLRESMDASVLDISRFYDMTDLDACADRVTAIADAKLGWMKSRVTAGNAINRAEAIIGESAKHG